MPVPVERKLTVQPSLRPLQRNLWKHNHLQRLLRHLGTPIRPVRARILSMRGLIWHLVSPSWHLRGLIWHLRAPSWHVRGLIWHLGPPSWHVRGLIWRVRGLRRMWRRRSGVRMALAVLRRLRGSGRVRRRAWRAVERTRRSAWWPDTGGMGYIS